MAAATAQHEAGGRASGTAACTLHIHRLTGTRQSHDFAGACAYWILLRLQLGAVSRDGILIFPRHGHLEARPCTSDGPYGAEYVLPNVLPRLMAFHSQEVYAR